MDKNDNGKNRLYIVIVVLAILLIGAVILGAQFFMKSSAADEEKKINDAYVRGVNDGQASALSAVQTRIVQSLQQNGYVDFSTTLDNNQTISERLWAESVIRAQLGQTTGDNNALKTAMSNP
jgi:hypothetical protein